MTEDKATADNESRPAVGAPVEPSVRPLDPKREALDREAWEALGCLSGLHPCMTVDWDRPLVVARTVFDAVQAEIREWQRRATDQRLAVEQMNRLYREKTQECERLRMALHEIAEEWAGAECGEPVHAQEAYAIGLSKRMYALAAESLRPNVALSGARDGHDGA